jgi:sugar phosphate permease
LKINHRWQVLGVSVLAQMMTGVAFFPGLATIGPVIASTYHLRLVQAGILFGGMQFGPVLTVAVWGLVADRMGDRFVLAVGLVSGAVALASAALAHSFILLVAALTVASMLMASTNVASTRAAAGSFAANERGLALGIRQMSVPLGGVVSALLLPGLALAVGTPYTFVVLAVMCGLVGMLATAVLSERDAEPSHDAGPDLNVWTDARLWRLAFGVGLLVLCQNSMLAYLVLFLTGYRHMSLQAAALVFLCTQLVGCASRVVLGRLSDRLGSRVRPIRWIALSLAVVMLVAAVMVDMPLAFVVPVMIVGTILSMGSIGLAYAATVEIAGFDQAGAAIGFETTLFAIMGTIAPVAFGVAATVIGWQTSFAVIAAVAIGGWLVLRRLATLEGHGWTKDARGRRLVTAPQSE